MQFEEDEARVSDEDPEFTGGAATEDVDEEFLVDDDVLVDDDAIAVDDDDEESDLTADL